MSDRYTILHTIETGGPGGAETVLLTLASSLDPNRFRSLVILPKEGWLYQQLQKRGVPVYLVAWKKWYDFGPLLEFVRIVRREKVDLIHSHLPGQNFYSCLLGRLTGRETIVTYHGPIELADAHDWKGAVKLWTVRHLASGVVVVCDFVGRMLAEAAFARDKISLIYNGVNADTLQQAPRAQVRAQLGLPPAAKLVGTVANIRRSKGYEFLIRAARNLLDRGADLHFIAVGDIDETLSRPLLDLVDRLALKDHFHFLGFRADVPAILADLDIFVLPSISEGFPLVLLEAMAAAKPAVVTRCGGPTEAVEDGVTGILVPPGDAEALAEGVSRLLSDAEWATALGANAVREVRRRFPVEGMIDAYQALYGTCLNGK